MVGLCQMRGKEHGWRLGEESVKFEHKSKFF